MPLFWNKNILRLEITTLDRHDPTYNKRHGKVLFRPPTPLKLQGLER